ncbi:Sorting nexin-24 [Trachymyrmex septentrionalis]|uniref:Sorting nexin-24 n=1 Tax=Trachymyrmex septentrionalis TaxID=34720 RepID=A0A195FWT5_9HYME|nr:PREDICTED: sorting nexin-24-like [Trachymyrmex septentrionalis]KYN45120.1 Sorting nexin-24 [Trachymyrmex septentrionalis]
MYEAFINGYRLADVSHGKPYYVYCIEVLESKTGTRHFIERRYSEFSALHRKLKKDNSDIAPFPPKRVRNSHPKVLEQRRAALELYIQKTLSLLATKQQVLNFLGIESQEATFHHRIHKAADNSAHNHPNTLGHHPVLTFHCDPYVLADSTSSLSDVVTNGVLLGIYKS